MTRLRKCQKCHVKKPADQGMITPAGYFCSIDHAVEYSKNERERIRLNEKRKEVRLLKIEKRNAHKALKEEANHTRLILNAPSKTTKTKKGPMQKKARKTQHRPEKEQKRTDIKWQHTRTQTAFNKMRVLEELIWFKERNQVPTCISCNRPLGNDVWACGHYKNKGHNAALRYVRENTFLQHNHRCNLQMSGDIQGTDSTRGFNQGIIERFGEFESQRIFAILNKRHQKNMPYHWLELENMRAEFNQRIKALQKVLNEKNE